MSALDSILCVFYKSLLCLWALVGGPDTQSFQVDVKVSFTVTAIDRDGLLGGPDMDLLADAAVAAGGPDHVIASAGVSSLADIRALATAGYAGATSGVPCTRAGSTSRRRSRSSSRSRPQ